LSLIEPIPALFASFIFLGILLYKRVNLGITLNATALLLGLLALNLWEIPAEIYRTSTDPLSISIVLATFGIMWLSQLYKETNLITQLSQSLSNIVRNSKFIISALPAVIGFLPVAGGALMSAPLVDAEADKLKLTSAKKAYVNIWFRHTIFPVYPISPVLIMTALLTGVALPLIILRQIPVVIIMISIGYFIALRKTSNTKNEKNLNTGKNSTSELKSFLVDFSPILATIFVVVILGLIGLNSSQQGFDVVIATLAGLMLLIAIVKPSANVIVKPLKSWGIYGITLAAYGAFLLRNTMERAGISGIFGNLFATGSFDIIILLTVVPAVLGFLTGSPSGGVAISVSILVGILGNFTPETAAIIYISSYLGYVISPTHLCFTFTADYFQCGLNRIYKYIIPSFAVAFATALLVYFLF